jgi:RNA polymerase sigma factor (sigma-70 family)
MTDAELIQLITKDDPRGIKSLYEGYRTEFVHWMVKFSRCDVDDAKELYQASVMIAYDNIRAGKLNTLSSSLKTYLFGVGKNLAWQRYRQEVRKQKASAEFYLQSYVNDESQEDIFSRESNLELVSACFSKLGDPCHTLLDMFYYQRKNMDEIAVSLDYKNTDTAKNQKYKCMERLRKMVEEEMVKQTTT